MHDDKELEKTFVDCLDNIFDEEKRKGFWRAMIVFYEWSRNPSINLFAPLNLGQQEREQFMSDYLKSSNLVRLESHSGYIFPYQTYETDTNDIYLKCVLRKLKTGRDYFEHLDLADLFIEFYLRNQPYLQDLQIKETAHGKYIKTQEDED
jgi:hypothetical protein